ERIVEREQRGGRRAEGVAGGGVGPRGRERFRDGGWKMVDGGGSLAESEGVFESFEEAGAVAFRKGHAVLDDIDRRFKVADRRLGIVGSEDLAVDEDAEVALQAEEGKEVLAFRVGGNDDREGDEHRLAGEVLERPGGGA